MVNFLTGKFLEILVTTNGPESNILPQNYI